MLSGDIARRVPAPLITAVAPSVHRASRTCISLHGHAGRRELNFVSSVGQKSVEDARSAIAAAGRLTALLAACFLAVHARVDPDLWGHIRFGLDALASGQLPITDPYSFTQDVPWINHEWLSEVAQAAAYRLGAEPGALLLKAIVLAAAFVILMRQAPRQAEPMRWWLIAAAMAAVAPAALTMRPQMWTLAAIPLLWRLLDSRRGLAAIPLLFATWANLHGGWIVGLGVGGLWLAGRAIDRRGRGAPWAEAAALAAGLLATLVNPYGWTLWRFLLTTVRPSRNVSEWRPLWQQDDYSSAVVWTIVMAVIVVPTLVRRRAALTWAGALPAAWLGAMSIFVARLVPLFGEVALLGFAGAWARAESPQRTQPTRQLIVDAVAIAAIVAVSLASQTRCLEIGNDPWTPDLQAAAALGGASAQGRLVLPFNWGEYAIWHFGPRLRVSIDGRRETVYSERTLAIQA